MASGVGHSDVATLGQEAFQNLEAFLVGSGLVDRSVPVHVNVEGWHAILKQEPNDLDVSLVARPVHRGVPAYFLGIWRLSEGVSVRAVS